MPGKSSEQPKDKYNQGRAGVPWTSGVTKGAQEQKDGISRRLAIQIGLVAIVASTVAGTFEIVKNNISTIQPSEKDIQDNTLAELVGKKENFHLDNINSDPSLAPGTELSYRTSTTSDNSQADTFNLFASSNGGDTISILQSTRVSRGERFQDGQTNINFQGQVVLFEKPTPTGTLVESLGILYIGPNA